jgi:predicted phage-related endonuclease
MTSITRTPGGDRAQWLKTRMQDVTGSDVGALFGCHPWKTVADLYAEKIGAYPSPDEAPAGPKARGTRLEKFVAGEIADRNPEWTVVKETDYYRDPETRLGGTPDYELYTSAPNPGSRCVLEIKTVAERDFKNIWKDPSCPEAPPLPPVWILLQATTYMYLTGAPAAKIGVMPIGEWSSFDPIVIDVPRNENVIREIKTRVAKFWDAVERGEPPEFDFDRDMPAIKALYGSADPGKIVDLRQDSVMTDLLFERDRLKASLKNDETLLEPVEAQIRARIGDAETALVNGFSSVTLKSQHRREHLVKASDFRVLRAKKA